MPPRTGQGVATWLMFIPLLVVPLIAVFGVPQLTPESAQAESSRADELDIGLGDPEQSPFGQELPTTSAQSNRDVPVFTASEQSFPAGDPFQNPAAFRSSESPATDAPPFGDASLLSTRATDPFSEINPQSPRRSDPPAAASQAEFHRTGDSDDDGSRSAAILRENLTWRGAVRKLNQLGVRQYSLEPAAEPNMFRFSCDFTPDDNPRLTHRFEAEAGQPLNAVGKVIQQVEAWLAQRNSP